MIDKNVVRKIVDEWLEDKDYFLVDIQLSPDGKIVVEIDHADGVWIEDCVELSKFIEERLSRDEEDYEFEVGLCRIGATVQGSAAVHQLHRQGSGGARQGRKESEVAS